MARRRWSSSKSQMSARARVSTLLGKRQDRIQQIAVLLPPEPFHQAGQLVGFLQQLIVRVDAKADPLGRQDVVYIVDAVGRVLDFPENHILQRQHIYGFSVEAVKLAHEVDVTCPPWVPCS